MKRCSTLGCREKHIAKGLCRRCYHLQRKSELIKAGRCGDCQKPRGPDGTTIRCRACADGTLRRLSVEPCPFCEKPRIHARARTCGTAACREQWRTVKQRAINFNKNRTEVPRGAIYHRNCNRCGYAYKGRGRLLCDTCRAFANSLGPSLATEHSLGRNC